MSSYLESNFFARLRVVKAVAQRSHIAGVMSEICMTMNLRDHCCWLLLRVKLLNYVRVVSMARGLAFHQSRHWDAVLGVLL